MIRLCLLFFFVPVMTLAQINISLDEAIALALDRNPAIKAAETNTQKELALKGTAIDIPKTSVSLLYGQYNSYRNDNNITITQQIPFPTVFSAQRGASKLRIETSKIQEGLTKSQLLFEIRKTYNRLLFLKKNQKLLAEQDSLFRELLRIAQIQHKTGEATLLNEISAEAQQIEVHHKLLRNAVDYSTELRRLQLYCQSDSISDVVGDLKTLASSFPITQTSVDHNPGLRYYKQTIELRNQEKKVEVSKFYPDLMVGFFSQTLIGPQQVNGSEQFFDSSERFQGVQVGIAIPLIFNATRARVKAADAAVDYADKEYSAHALSGIQHFHQERQSLEKNKMSIDYYENTALKHADLLASQSQKAFKEGELDYATLLLNIRQVLVIREGYLNALYDYNESTILILQLTGN
jgi:heavy metal efflux system protein